MGDPNAPRELPEAEAAELLKKTKLDIQVASTPEDAYGMYAAHGFDVSYFVLAYPANKKRKPTVWSLGGPIDRRRAMVQDLRTRFSQRFGQPEAAAQNTVALEFEKFMTMIGLPPTQIPPEQFSEMKKAFFAGAYWMLTQTEAISVNTDTEEQMLRAFDRLNALKEELEASART